MKTSTIVEHVNPRQRSLRREAKCRIQRDLKFTILVKPCLEIDAPQPAPANIIHTLLVVAQMLSYTGHVVNVAGKAFVTYGTTPSQAHFSVLISSVLPRILK